MEESIFTIQFPEHLPPEKWKYCLSQLAADGAEIIPVSTHVYNVVCKKPNQLKSVGKALFHTNFSNLCKVIKTSGLAEPRANAYK